VRCGCPAIVCASSLDTMYDIPTRERALALCDQGLSLNSVSKLTGISRAAIRSWRARLEPRPLMHDRPCERCRPHPAPPATPQWYAYLLGLYLGDGCISRQRSGGYQLRIFCADAWPGLISLCREAIRAVRPEDTQCTIQKQGCVEIASYGRHWTCLFPQHGPGKKHERPIVLADWQRTVVDAHTWDFVRGLVHSDGCRNMNWTTRLVAGQRKRYEYPRYYFTNVSDDITQLYTEALDSLGVRWRRCTRNAPPHQISVAQRASVALMDAHVGPKF
jgi:hypothetical protein